MKHQKKAPKKDKLKTKSKPKASANKELSEDQLEHVAGGAVDAYLKITGVQGTVTGGTDYKEIGATVASNPLALEYLK
jgi:hypothetical protein